MQITTQMADELERYLKLSTLELKLTAQNMANVDTPGYRTMGFDFETEMKRSVGELEAQRRAEEEGTEMPAEPGIAVGQVDHLLERPDGNNVSMDREGLNMAQAQLQFRAGVELLKHEYSTVMDAIHVDQK
ncbi:flagellar basal body rod protein FlgB [Paracidobacterium acidisoli]|uniref:Flagellar basal body rod protein FlgB n=1 Tax=Paracidobacterium acidisoli TaxID=2303751 RepID=A0A372IRL9_9BACT|nr:flagellar basal body rod protein FlgB [Paracidobacterium acidisoli]MBT9330286.1 flagellar basal body rod protein FlgB [Paracidobacterium acidisoli]